MGKLVLVVDDEDMTRQMIAMFLKMDGLDTIEAEDGVEALKQVSKHQPDAIILDVMMPEMDGWEFLQRLRGMPHLADTPVIICSVFNDPELAYSLGASANLPKPVSRPDVLSVLHQLGVV